MDFLSISAQDWVLNEDENLKRLLEDEIWDKVPLINANGVHNFKDGTLVKFRGMIQDMYGPEYYLEKFHVVNESTNETTARNGKYCDGTVLGNAEKNDFDCARNVLSERQSYVVTSIPGVNSWVHQHETDAFKVIPTQENVVAKSNNKRGIDEVTMDVDEDISSQKKVSSTSATPQEPNKNLLVSQEHLLNHPLANEKSKVCHIKVYKESDSLKLNDTCDFVGFLSVNPAIAQIDQDEGSEMEIQTHHPPSSLVPRIHIVHFKMLDHINPLVKAVSSANLPIIKKELLIVLTQLLMGDALAAEYLIYNLISEVYLRKDFMPLGKFSMNISNVPHLENIDYVSEIYKFLELMLPKSHYLPLSLENMNTLSFTPKKDYECNRLTSGILQLSKNTLLVLDETKLAEGKLDMAGVQGVKALANAIKHQKVLYDFNYYPIEYECDIPFLIFSEGKSMLPADVHVALKPDDECLKTFSEILDAARHFLNPELLNDIRKYLTEARLMKYEISDQAQDVIQQEFVAMRQSSNITAEDLHGLLVLTRLVCISEGKSSLDAACWKKACEMERERKSRLIK